MSLRLQVIIGSTRPGRFADKPAAWIVDRLSTREDFELDVLDLRDHPLPLFDSSMSPARTLREYPNEAVAKLGQRFDSADVDCLPDPGEPPLPTNHSAFYAHYGNDNWFPEFDPDPVRGLPQDFYDWNPPLPSALNPKETRHISFCRGTPLTIRTGTSTGPFQSTFNLGPLGQERRGAIKPNPPDRID